MIQLEQMLQDLHIAPQQTPVGETWHALTVEEIETIKRIFIQAGFTPPKNLDAMTREQLFYDTFAQLLSNYVGDSVKKNQFDRAVFNEILRLARVAAGIEQL